MDELGLVVRTKVGSTVSVCLSETGQRLAAALGRRSVPPQPSSVHPVEPPSEDLLNVLGKRKDGVRTLQYLAEHPDISQRKISEQLEVSRGQISMICRAFTKHGLLEIVAGDNGDRHIVTDLGQRALAWVKDHPFPMNAAHGRTVPVHMQDRETLAKILEKQEPPKELRYCWTSLSGILLVHALAERTVRDELSAVQYFQSKMASAATVVQQRGTIPLPELSGALSFQAIEIEETPVRSRPCIADEKPRHEVGARLDDGGVSAAGRLEGAFLADEDEVALDHLAAGQRLASPADVDMPNETEDDESEDGRVNAKRKMLSPFNRKAADLTDCLGGQVARDTAKLLLAGRSKEEQRLFAMERAQMLAEWEPEQRKSFLHTLHIANPGMAKLIRDELNRRQTAGQQAPPRSSSADREPAPAPSDGGPIRHVLAFLRGNRVDALHALAGTRLQSLLDHERWPTEENDQQKVLRTLNAVGLKADADGILRANTDGIRRVVEQRLENKQRQEPRPESQRAPRAG